VSRVGKHPIQVPGEVTLSVTGQTVAIKGKKGEFNLVINDGLKVDYKDNLLTLALDETSSKAKTLWGTTRSVLQNMITGAGSGFSKTLDINGVGYKAATEGNTLVLNLGFSHDVRFPIPAGITIQCPKPTQIVISGASKQQVGQVASEIRAFRSPEPYKGKGIKYENETILRKEGKKK
jgi:large subunit ribosomal protein L6